MAISTGGVDERAGPQHTGTPFPAPRRVAVVRDIRETHLESISLPFALQTRPRAPARACPQRNAAAPLQYAALRRPSRAAFTASPRGILVLQLWLSLCLTVATVALSHYGFISLWLYFTVTLSEYGSGSLCLLQCPNHFESL